MDARDRKAFRLSLQDVKEMMGYLEESKGANRFSRAIERKLVEEFVEKDWEIKKSPVPGFETNLEYLFSLIPELYTVSKELSENAGEFALSLVHLLRVCQKENTPQPKRVLH